MTRHTTAVFVSLMPLLLLAGCGDDADVATEDDGREASGEVLDGTISDAMLPVDEVRSQAPLVVESPSATGDGESGETPSDPASEPVEAATEGEPAPPAQPPEE